MGDGSERFEEDQDPRLARSQRLNGVARQVKNGLVHFLWLNHHLPQGDSQEFENLGFRWIPTCHSALAQPAPPDWTNGRRVTMARGHKMPYDGIEAAMSKRELIARELDHMPEQDVDRLLAYMRALKETHAEAAMPALAAESSLAKDWLAPEEDAAWANL